MKKIFFAVITLLPTLLSAQVKQVKLTDFDMQSSAIIKEDAATISGKDYHSKNYWFPVKVPSTVLTGLVANKVYPDPYTGMNNMLIPDASDSFNRKYNLEQYSYLPNDPNPWKKPYWYRTVFNVPAADKGKIFQLIFKGINYRAEVWVNGKQFADSSQMAGMFAEYSLNVTDAIEPGDSNVLAVKIYPLDYPGEPAPPQLKALGDFFLNGGPTGDIGKNITMLCSVGWDWIPEVHDRNMGIWQPVYLRTTGSVVIQQPHIITELPKLPDTSLAELSLNVSLKNNGNAAAKGKLKITISPETFEGKAFDVEKEVMVEANAVKEIKLSADDVKQFVISKPHLWWPNNYGDPDLYRVRLQYISANTISDDTSFLFGIRTVSSEVRMVKDWARRDFYVNGKRVHLVGGAWVPDMMLNRDSLRNDYELHLCRNANINLVRIWGGGLAETDDFYELADRYGLLVWQDFWITGDTQGEFKGSPDYPLQGEIFKRNVISTIYRIRNHASLLVWTGGNEGHARKELYDAMRDNITQLDGTRPFIPSSSGFAKLPQGFAGSWPDDKPSGVYSGGPYRWQEPSKYYELINKGKDWVFKDETGIPSQPPYSSLAKNITPLVPDDTIPYPLNNVWGYHDACIGAGHFEDYYKQMASRFGAPAGMKDYADKMQLMNADGYRGIFEAAAHKLNDNGGVMLWKLNAAFPSVIWQVYDWFLQPNAGYYFMQRACAPLHVQFNYDDSAVAVINRSYQPYSNLTVDAQVIDISGKPLYRQSRKINMRASAANEFIPLVDVLAKQKDVVFVVLHVRDEHGKTISENTYWLQPENDYTSFGRMPAAVVSNKVIASEKKSGYQYYTLQFTNTSSQFAFFINPQLMVNNEEVMPAFWSNNYFSLMPNESTTVTVSCPLEKLNGKKPQITIAAWNVTGVTTELP
ncbi:glycosyl hydrolase 2 galactose-binding domain-containing protein [Parafilimonas sp.]|uniref:glycosyl hydrolase 2 galactose-binding domain-containing protein n=1 Tax=Parafilimonas sp. TaxID=1969739 RepID=UPI0039E6BE62